MAGKKITKKVVKKVKTVRKTAGRAKKVVAKPAEVHIDFPREGDVVPNKGHYAVRIGAKHGNKVEITFDNKSWHRCRESVGYFWYDWSPKKSAKVTLIARAKNGTNVSKRSVGRKVTVAK